MTIANLQRLIARIEAETPAENPPNGMYLEYEAFRAWQRDIDAFAEKLVAEEGGRLGHATGAAVIRLAGVQASCTSGPKGLLDNWRRAAERKIAATAGAVIRRPLPGSIEAGLSGGLSRDEIGSPPAFGQDDCPGHVASHSDAKVCGRCGVHIDSLSPDDDGFNPFGSGPVPVQSREG